MSDTLHAGDVIQITNESHSWFPALLIVDEVKSFGCQAFCIIPKSNDGSTRPSEAYTRLNAEDYERIGIASISHQEGQ